MQETLKRPVALKLLRAEIAGRRYDQAEDEIGDMLFAVANVARLLEDFARRASGEQPAFAIHEPRHGVDVLLGLGQVLLQRRPDDVRWPACPPR